MTTNTNTNTLAAAILGWAFALPAHTMWVSAGGGTANVLAGALARHLGISFDAAHAALNAAGGPDWYGALYTRHHLADLDGQTADAAGVAKFLKRNF